MHDEFLKDYKPIHLSLMKYCKGRSFGILETEDLLQETILRTLLKFEQIRNRDKLLSFMIGVTNNIIRNHIRKHPGITISDDWIENQLIAKNLDPNIALDVQHLYFCIHQLDLIDQELLILYEINGFKLKEIAQILNMNISTVKTRLRRTRIILKAEFEEKAIKPQAFAETLSIFLTLIIPIV